MLSLLVVSERFDFAGQETGVYERFMRVEYEVEYLCADWNIWHHGFGGRRQTPFDYALRDLLIYTLSALWITSRFGIRRKKS